MQFEVKEIDSIKRLISVTVAPEELQEIETKALKDLRKSVSMPGFRKGKAPAGMVKKSYADFLQKEVLESALSRFYSQALSESKLEVISQGTIQDIKFVKISEGMTFDIEVEVQPEIVLKKYTGLKVEKEKVAVTDEMIQEALENIQKNYATTQAVDKAEEGHIVTMTVQELGDGDTPIIGRKYEDVTAELGSGQFDVELEKQLIGVSESEERVIRRVAEAPGSDQPPKTESYRAIIKSVEKRDLPAINDELAKTIDEENIDTLDDLRKTLRERMEDNLRRRSAEQLNQRLIDELLKENPFDVPESMVNNYLKYIVDDIKRKNPKAKVDEQVIRQQYRVEAIHGIRWHLLKDKLIDVENMLVTEDEVMLRIDSYEISQNHRDEIKKNKDFVDRIRNDILEDKVMKFLSLQAEITEVEPPEDPSFGAAVDAPGPGREVVAGK